MSAQPRITKAGLHTLDPLAYRDIEALHRAHLQSASDQGALLIDPRYTSVNVASVFNGAVGTATSTIAGANPNGALVGDRAGVGYVPRYTCWIDNTATVFPDTLTATFNRPCVIDRVDVFTANDGCPTGTPQDITPTLTFTAVGLTAFDVQYQDGAGAWQTIKSVTGNTLVWNTFTFTAVVAQAVRVVCNASINGQYSVINSLEAWLAK